MMMPIVSDAEQRIRSVKGCACRFVLKGVCSSTRYGEKNCAISHPRLNEGTFIRDYSTIRPSYKSSRMHF